VAEVGVMNRATSKITAGVAALVFVLSCVVLAQESEKVEFCSIINLIATPEKYEGKRIRTEGVATIGFESTAIYLSSESAINGVGVNGIALALDPSKRSEKVKSLNMKWVLVEGVYRRSKHETQWRGYIDDITLLYAPKDVKIE
jgi:hypothetical protein